MEDTQSLTTAPLAQHSMATSVSTKGVVTVDIKTYVATPAELEIALQTHKHLLTRCAVELPTFVLTSDLLPR